MEIKKIKKVVIYFSIILIVLLTLQMCKTYQFRSNYQDLNTFLHETNDKPEKLYLKAHLKNGDVCILRNTWQIDTIQNYITGDGQRFDFNRKKIYEGDILIMIDSISIFETNKKLTKTEVPRIAALSILTTANVALFLYCQSNPKACYGSCPTFYLNENDNFHYADAEGFSNAISPSMEYHDIDALNNPTITENTFSITMKNEALETHCVNNVKLLVYPRKKGERIYHDPSDSYYLCENIHTISQASANEGNITSLLKYDDKQERFSLSDENNLFSKETIYLDFDNINESKDLGLILNFRQTLMTTYLFYSALGYMGDEMSDIFSILEKDSSMRDKFDATTKILGGIEIYQFNEQNKEWNLQKELIETGPIAINKQFIPLQNSTSNSKIKLKIILNKGLWRIDYAALTNIIEKVRPIEITPNSIINDGIHDKNALSSINSDSDYLISMPGDKYKLNFELPNKNTDYELFLYAKGYYLEWMRTSWIKDKDLFKLKQMVDNPKTFLKNEAKNFKQYEASMEQQFWNSKIDTKILSYNEN